MSTVYANFLSRRNERYVVATLGAWLGDPAVDDKIGPSPLGVTRGTALDDRLAKVYDVHGL